MADLPALPPRRSVTAGRSLPPQAEGAAAPVAAAAPAAPALAAVTTPAPAARLAKPDARPMRWAFGAGAVAAVSILTVGFVKPDFAGTEEPVGANDAAGQQSAETTNQRARARVNRVTRYVYLERGERAPRGATVITADEAPGRRTAQRDNARAEQPATGQSANRARPDRPAATSRPPSNERPPNNDRPAADPQPRPEPPPRTTTHQSGG